jgi:hypothetical protein
MSSDAHIKLHLVLLTAYTPEETTLARENDDTLSKSTSWTSCESPPSPGRISIPPSGPSRMSTPHGLLESQPRQHPGRYFVSIKHSRHSFTPIQAPFFRAGFPKKTETLYFFVITDKDKFRTDLRSFNPLVKTVAQVLADRQAIKENKRKCAPGSKPSLIPMVGVNIAFSHFGFQKVTFISTNH